MERPPVFLFHMKQGLTAKCSWSEWNALKLFYMDHSRSVKFRIQFWWLKLESNIYLTILIHVKGPPLCTKSNMIHMGLWLYAVLLYFDSSLHCHRLCTPVLPSISYIIYDKQNTLDQLYPNATFPFFSKTQFSLFFLPFLSFRSYHFLHSFFQPIRTNHGSPFHWRNRVGGHVRSQPWISSSRCGSNKNKQVLYSLQHRQTSCVALPEMDRVLKYRSKKKDCKGDEGQRESRLKTLKLITIANLFDPIHQEACAEQVAKHCEHPSLSPQMQGKTLTYASSYTTSSLLDKVSGSN